MHGDNTLASLPIPLPSVGIHFATTADELATLAEHALETEKSWGIHCKSKEIITEFAVTRVGGIEVTTGRTKPVALQYRNGERITIEMCYGGQSRFNEGITKIQTYTGEILAFPNSGGILCGGHHAGISFCLEKARLRRTAQAIYGKNLALDLNTPQAIVQSKHQKGQVGAELLFSLFKMIDEAIAENHMISEEMNLDDQLYRAYAIILARGSGKANTTEQEKRSLHRAAFDDLVDYIRTNAALNLTLTDLEEKSHYSARQLQNLFRQKFDCTPMQFVRRQKLSTAMGQLQDGSLDESVTSIARKCGYRFTSNFSSDFHREYGVAPSAVLRASRSQGHKA